jgi:hypothetical protein
LDEWVGGEEVSYRVRAREGFRIIGVEDTKGQWLCLCGGIIVISVGVLPTTRTKLYSCIVALLECKEM